MGLFILDKTMIVFKVILPVLLVYMENVSSVDFYNEQKLKWTKHVKYVKRSIPAAL